MFNHQFDFITDWTVSAVQFSYRLLVQNTYFILSNSLFLILLLFLRLTMNNFVFFIVPIFFLLASFSAQFKSIQESKEDTISIGRYISLYKEVLKNGWQTFLVYTFFIVLIVLDLRILFVANLTMMMYLLIIVGCFLLSSMFFVLVISTDTRVKAISLKRRLVWSLFISCRLPLVTLVNFLYVLLAIFFLQNFSLAYLCFLGGAVNYYVYLNVNRRFSIDLFFEQMNR
ncbi:hypothetical protein IW492_14840 [Enterococcus sp. BWB1-3]|uniref:hypothetical protein n=1 Tax=unclassified Enterococcus TaxID=2608891 RepID=UPI0019204886|nr:MULTISPECIES: hypothetical protein [unclassified Enterococcus]MBL1230506.1 hypothetical protein [Enterococcus sp. BWB1-3]MCB5954221.1 hypothetical protein [Enterococcus sp. CWB-B31]